jgi:hypothetical protein
MKCLKAKPNREVLKIETFTNFILDLPLPWHMWRWELPDLYVIHNVLIGHP